MDPAADIPQGVDSIPDSPHVNAQRLPCSLALAGPVSKVLDDDNHPIEMMDPAPIPQQADPIQSTTSKRLRCSATSANPVSKALFPQTMSSDQKKAEMVGYDEESNAIVLATYIGDFILQLDSMQFRRISKRNCPSIKLHYPYRNFYTAGRGVGWKSVDQNSEHMRSLI